MNEKFYALPEEKQSQILNAAYKVFATNQYKKAPQVVLVMRYCVVSLIAISKKFVFFHVTRKNRMICATHFKIPK